MPIQVLYDCPSILHQEKRQFSLVGIRLPGSQLHNSKEQVPLTPHLQTRVATLWSQILYQTGRLLEFQQCMYQAQR